MVTIEIYLVRKEEALIKYLIFGKKLATLPKSLILLAERLCGEEIADLRRKRCPFCGRVFKNKVGLYRHLCVSSSRLEFVRVGGKSVVESIYTNPCHILFSMMVEDIVNKWWESVQK